MSRDSVLAPGSMPGRIWGIMMRRPGAISGRALRSGVPILVGVLLVMGAPAGDPTPFPEPAIAFAPRSYICQRAQESLSIDGRATEPAWQAASWTAAFVDIEGPARPGPRFTTRAKLLWDDAAFYFFAELEEPDVWAKLTARDAVIYHDNDFEIFIDPDGDTQDYYELEVNAFGTEWDLILIKPYRDGGPAINAWDIQGLQTGIHIDGTLNRPGDRDRGWSVEIAIPWEVLGQCAHRTTPPQAGDQWRVNFSRVEWQTEVIDGTYRKLTDPESGKSLPEANWVWSPQGLINMHYPEMWGFVQFSAHPAGAGEAPFALSAAEEAKWALRRLYYRQQTHRRIHGTYAASVAALGLSDPRLADYAWPPELQTTANLFEAILRGPSGETWHIAQDGHTWSGE